jgi:O-antigen/teichoic acid export membrane protein
LIDKLKKNDFWKSIITLSTGQIIAQSLNLFLIPIISRIYSKEAYGDFAIVTSTATIIIGFVGVGLNTAIMAADNEEEANKVFTVGFYIQALLTTILILGMLIISPYYRFFESYLEYTTALIVMFFYILLSVLATQLTVYVNRLKLDKILFYNSLRGALSNLLITLPLGLLGVDSLGMYIATIASLIYMNINILRHVKPFYLNIKLNDFIFVAKKYKEFIIFQYPANLVGIFTNQMPIQFLSANFSLTQLGDYSMCNRVFQLPMSFIATPIQTVYFRFASQKFKNGEDIADFTYSIVSKILYIAFLPVIIIMVFGKPIFEFVLGTNWGVAGEISSILILQFLFSFCTSCIVYCRVTIGKQRVNLYISIIQFIMTIVSLIIGIFVFKSFIGTIISFAIINTIFGILNITVNFLCLKKYYYKFSIFSILYCLLCISVSFVLKQLL